MECKSRQCEDKSKKVSMQFLSRCAFKQYISNYQIHFRAIIAVLMILEAKKSVNLPSKSGCPNLNALKISKQYSKMTTTASGVYACVVLLYKSNIIQSRSFLIKNIWHFEKWYFILLLLGFRRKLTALTLCKSIESAIQWFQIHHWIAFATIPNSAVYLSGAKVSIFPTLVPRLLLCNSWFH